MKSAKEDRRSQRTRQLLSEALIGLLVERRYDLISVQDILDRANVGRSTFYAHYHDKEDLLVSEFQRMLDHLTQQIAKRTDGDGPALPSLGLFRHVRDHQRLYKALLWGRGIDLLFKRGHAHLSGLIEAQLTVLAADQPPGVPVPIAAHALAGTLLTLLQWWLDHDMPYSPEEMDAFYQQLALPGALAALGVPPAAP